MESNIDEAKRQFPDHVRDHTLTVERDEGVYRHLRFAKPGTYNMSFQIHTWPGYLCFCGDMGAYLFTRVEDMLAFFRHDTPNYGYWAEKCVAQDRSGVRQYSQEQFTEKVREMAKEATEGLDGPTRAAVLEAVDSQVIEYAEDESAARSALAEFEEHGVAFFDTWELNFQEYTYRFAWCCNALVWAVKQYDAQRLGGAP